MDEFELKINSFDERFDAHRSPAFIESIIEGINDSVIDNTYTEEEATSIKRRNLLLM